METNKTELLVCVVTKLWICWFQFPVLDCDRLVKCSDTTGWMYYAYIVSKMYGSLKSFQTATSFQVSKALCLVYFLDFFAPRTKNHVTFMV
jgi:hypothetical protein